LMTKYVKEHLPAGPKTGAPASVTP